MFVKAGSIAGLLALVVATATACSPYVRRGEALYHEGRYVEAAEVFELTEENLPQSTPEVCAEYSLYRGLTYLRLDDLASARVWLNHASQMAQRDPSAFTAVQHAALVRGRAEVEQRLSTTPSGPTPATRFAASEEPAPVARLPK
jgi:Flp pilus assembly protein TadD